MYLVYRYTTNYGGWARTQHREGLGEETKLQINDKLNYNSNNKYPENEAIMNALVNNIGVYGKGLIDGTELEPNDVRGNVTIVPNNLGITVDGDPPEIQAVEYKVNNIESADVDSPYLNVGDSLEIDVQLAEIADGERVYVDPEGFFPFNTGTKATLIEPQESYGSNDWIKYKYTVEAGDPNTNYLKHLIDAEPKTEAYADAVFDMAKKMGIHDDYNNVAMMLKTGKDRLSTLLFTQVQGKDGAQIYVDTIAPKVKFDSSDFATYKRAQTYELIPDETGSMLEGGTFYYYINKDPDNPTGTTFDDHLGVKIYPYTREGSNVDSGYSSIEGIKDILIDNSLYHGVSGYTDYDTYYNPITGDGYYPDVDYEAGTASDVVYEGRREITGTFYIHTYMKDLSGNESWQTSQAINLDNTKPIISLNPTSTTRYVADVNINFGLIDGGISGFDHYDYRWMDANDLDINTLDSNDRYTTDSYTYGKLTDASSDWVKGNAIDAYNQSKIPIPAFDERLHGPSYLLIRAYDKPGNVEYIVSSAFYFDKKAPTVSFETIGNDDFSVAKENHQIKVKADDVDTGIADIRYYFSQSNTLRDKDDAIWKHLKLDFAPLPEDYDANYEGPALSVKEATLDTKDWTEERLNGYSFLHVYTVDYAGNEQFYTQDILIDNGGLPSIGFDYDGAIDNRYKSVIGHIRVNDDSGAGKVQYAFTTESSADQEPTTYSDLDLSGVTNHSNFTIDTPAYNTNGTWYLHVKVTDSKGNVSTAVSDAYVISSSTPEAGLFTINTTDTFVTDQNQVSVDLSKSINDDIEYTYKVYTDEALTDLQSQGAFKALHQTVGIDVDTTQSSDSTQTYYIKLYNDLMIPLEDTFEVHVVYDNIAPTAEITYSPEEADGTSQTPVVASLVNLEDDYSESENLVLSEADYTFNSNGKHTFTITDQAGNVGTVTAEVTWISESNLISIIDATENVSTPSRTIDFTLDAYDYSTGSAVSVGNSEDVKIKYQISDSTTVDETAWKAYEGDTISLSEYDDGTYYVLTQITSEGQTYYGQFGPYILDTTAPTMALHYHFDCTDAEGNVQTFDGREEEGEYVLALLKASDHTPIELTAEKPEESGQPAEEPAEPADPSDPAEEPAEPETVIPNQVTQDGVTVTLVADSDALISGVDQLDASEDVIKALTIQSEYTFKYNDHLKISFHDAAGNTETKEIIMTALEDGNNAWGDDSTPPVGNITVTDFDAYNKKIAIAITDESAVHMTSVVFTPADTSKEPIEFDLEMNQTMGGVSYNINTYDVITSIEGIIQYTFEDAAGNKGSAQKEVNDLSGTGVDLSKVSVAYQVAGSETSYNSLEALGQVNKDVTVTLTLPEGYTVANNGGNLSRSFSDATTFDFLIYNGFDLKSLTIDLSQAIKKTGPSLDMQYLIDGTDYKSKLTDGKTGHNVDLKITSTEDLASVSFNGTVDTTAPYTYTFNQNGTVTIVATDMAGNTTSMKGFVDCIDKEPTRAGLFSLYTQPTKEATINLQFKATKAVTVTMNNIKKDGHDYLPETMTGTAPSNLYTFPVNENGTYSVTYTDDLGNVNTVELVVNNFDREAPVLKLLYNDSESQSPTKENVLVKVVLVDEDQEPYGIKVLNTPSNSDTMLFKENGVFTFRVEDMAGNLQTIEAVVDSIDREAPSYTVSYSETGNTSHSVVATVEITDQDPAFKILNSDLNITDPSSAYNQHVTVDGQKIKVTFNNNGFYRLRISDLADNEETIVLRVNNIDKVKPTLTFDNAYLVTGKNEMPLLSDFVAYDDHDGNINDRVSISEPDTSASGTVNASYTVTDTAGNILEVQRPVSVIGDDYAVIANGQSRNSAFRVDGSKLEMTIYNYIETVNVKYLKADMKGSGNVKPSAFKNGGILYDSANDEEGTGHVTMDFSAAEPGWYTFYVQDINHQTQILTVFFTGSERVE